MTAPAEKALVFHLTDKQLRRLIALDGAATPGPWRAMMQGNSRLLDGTHVGQARLEPVPRPYEPRWVGFQNEATALEWHHSTVMREEDAELIAMLRNLLPSLLSSPSVESVRRMREALEKIAGHYGDVGSTYREQAYLMRTTALAALPALPGEDKQARG